MEKDSSFEMFMKKVQASEKRQHTSNRESQGLAIFDQLIKNEKVLELQNFDFRDEILETIFSDYCTETVKEEKDKQYIVDYICQGIGDKKCNVLKKTAFGKKYAKGKEEKGKEEKEKGIDFDYDRSNLSTYVFCKTILRHIDTKLKVVRGKKGPYGAEVAMENYSLSGETMNSWATTLEKFFKAYWKEYYVEDFPGVGKPLWEYLSQGENYKYEKTKKPLPLYITDFLEVVYTIGNFIPLPKNRPNLYSDYWDLFLAEIYNYFYPKGKIGNYVKVSSDPDYNEWLKTYYGDEKQRWNAFVERNYMQPFVEKLEGEGYGKPLELWDGHFNGKLLPDEEWQFEQFFVNARIRILRRGWLIANALIENEKEDANDKKRSD